MHSFRIHVDGSTTWTLQHEKPVLLMPKPKGDGDHDVRAQRAPSKRTLRSRERARAHAELMRRAQDIRLRRIIQWWSRTSQPLAAGASPQCAQVRA